MNPITYRVILEIAFGAIEYYQLRGWPWKTVAEFLLRELDPMATRYGWEKANWLQKRGWTVKGERPNIPPDELPFGDATMIDPVTGKEHTPYEGERIQLERERNGGLGI